MKRIALRLLGNDLALAANIIAAVATQATHIERNFLQALEKRQPSELQSTNEYEAGRFKMLALVDFWLPQLRLKLDIKCNNIEALRLVAASLPNTRFRATDVQLEDSSLRCYITLGLSREQVAAYLEMLPR